MGTAKASLEWHGSTLLWRTVRILERATGGPVVVARAAGQALPVLPPGTEVVDDPRSGLGPLQGIAAGLWALSGRAEMAFVASTDLPFLHPAFVSRVLRAVQEGADVGLPVARGFRQPLAAAYRTSLASVADRLVRAGLVKPAFLFDECDVAFLDEAALRADPQIAAVDPDLDSVVNVNEPADYEAARARQGPEVTVAGSRHGQRVRAATLAEAATAVGLAADQAVTAVLNGELTTADAQMPLVAGDVVAFRA
jgi:molybdopterin-guanine dinucleotide biosynthesis protein A